MIKKLFTIDDFAIAFVSALGYGYGETISRLSGWPRPACTAACFVLGIGAEAIISRIIFRPAIQKKVQNRILTYAAILLLFLAAHAASVRWMGVSMTDYLLAEFGSVVVFSFLGFFLNLCIRGYRILKVRRQSEDCLTLNIWVRAEKPDEKKPVLVLFHHGDFSFGGAADPLLYGDHFLTSHPDAVVVSFNWRLGIFGFIDFSEVPGGEAYPDTRNLGLLDQIAALQ